MGSKTYLSLSVYQARAFPILQLDPAARPEETSRSLSAASSPKSSTASRDDGHEYRPYRVGRTPGLLENISEGNTLPLIALVSTRHPPLPKTFKDAMASPEAESWYAASVKELNSMGLHKAFKQVSSSPTGARALGYRWVFTRKEDVEGNIISYKAQLVVQGFAPRLGIDYNKTLALVSSITTILFVVRLCAAQVYLPRSHVICDSCQ
ncbi:BQ5605_C007g04872 [Microbotryum silenes-dioicae]|uniref:BQ5605_C007g04872 protein n=1 Tax=Microbotryum silenes-dioicae TaxID=796604 RepID=A0A2X0PAK1_9BASI|nr:BQ5605_C007g04872 [Microbotryum silenes-dioicae]